MGLKWYCYGSKQIEVDVNGSWDQKKHQNEPNQDRKGSINFP